MQSSGKSIRCGKCGVIIRRIDGLWYSATVAGVWCQAWCPKDSTGRHGHLGAESESRVIQEGSYVAFMRNETETEAGTVFRITSKPKASYVSIMTDDGHVYVRDVTRVRFVSEVVADSRKD